MTLHILDLLDIHIYTHTERERERENMYRRSDLMRSMIIILMENHRCSNIHLFLIHTTCFGLQFRPSSGDIT